MKEAIPAESDVGMRGGLWVKLSTTVLTLESQGSARLRLVGYRYRWTWLSCWPIREISGRVIGRDKDTVAATANWTRARWSTRSTSRPRSPLSFPLSWNDFGDCLLVNTLKSRRSCLVQCNCNPRFHLRRLRKACRAPCLPTPSSTSTPTFQPHPPCQTKTPTSLLLRG